MIKATVNGKVFEFDKEDYENFGDFFEQKKIPGMVLSKIEVNENEVSISKIDDLLKATFEGNENIVLEFVEIIPFTLNLIDELFVFLGNFKKALPDFASSLMSGDSKAISGLTNLHEGIKSLEAMKDNLYSLTGIDDSDLPGFKEKHDEILNVLNGMNDSIQRKDWLNVSDLIEYEFVDKLSYYDEVFTKTREILDSRKS